MRVIISGGGTGGHIYPALAIAEEMQGRGAQVLYMGGYASAEEELAAAYGFDFRAVRTAPLHRNLPRLAADLYENYCGLRQAKRIIADYQPALAIGTGGFVTAPVLMAAERLHIPTLIHEQNACPGLANHRLAHKASAVCLTFSAAASYFPHQERIYHTGLPLRPQILALAGQAKPEAANQAANAANQAANAANQAANAAWDYFHIPATERNLPTLLITGGSQGAERLNKAALAAYKPLLSRGIRIIHLCGKNNYLELRQKAPQDSKLILLPYLEQMEHALALADLAVARAGASFLAEAAVTGLPTILIPYPYAAGDHQRANARAFNEADAALVIEDEQLNGESLRENVLSLLDNPARLGRMREGALSLAKPDARSEIAAIAFSIMGQNH
jgi:UDP-N-acetylglucosamine--N-acetylmuramyl-(pentapeptide) pyrophosphoryl-undecaprenol N-acetylglucosamine transferase